MPTKVTWNGNAFIQRVRQTVALRLETTGLQGKAEVQGHTPRRTGVLQDSEHYVVLDETGGYLAGEKTDGNGNAIPEYGGNGMLRVVVGSNEGAEVGYWYAHWVEAGIRGQPGRAMFAQTFPIMLALLKRELERGLP